MVNPFIWLILTVLDIYTWVIVAAVIASWLVSFGVINIHNQFVRWLVFALQALTEPVLRPLRRIIPPMGGLDLTPLVALLLIQFVRYLIVYYLA
ncbi:MAG: YggT family protein [Alphaproteobacteria bacterium]